MTAPSKLSVEIAEAITRDILDRHMVNEGEGSVEDMQDAYDENEALIQLDNLIAALIDAKLAPLAPRPVLHWKPIESAPKDDAILVCEGHEKSLPVIAVWVDTRRGGQWHMFGTELETKPEYWMPIPNPPAQRPAQEGSDKT